MVIKEADVYHSLMKHLKLIKHKRQQFLSLLFKLFGIERLTDIYRHLFISWPLLSMDRRNLKRSIERWFSSGMEESRGKWALSNEIRQDIYDTWVENITPSTDDRNDRVSVKIAKLAYLKKYKEIENKTVQLKEGKNKRGCTIIANRMILTETVCSIQKKTYCKRSKCQYWLHIKSKAIFHNVLNRKRDVTSFV